METTVIMQVAETKFFGVIIDQHISWKPHISFFFKTKGQKLWRLLRKPAFIYHPKRC